MFAGREKQGSKSVKMTCPSEGDVNKVMSFGCSEAVVYSLTGTDVDDTKYAETTKDVINLSFMNVAAILLLNKIRLHKQISH